MTRASRAASASWRNSGSGFAELGPLLIDPGNPIARAVAIDAASVSDRGGANPISSYTVIEADDMQSAIEFVKRGPIVQGGRTVEIAETTTSLQGLLAVSRPLDATRCSARPR